MYSSADVRWVSQTVQALYSAATAAEFGATVGLMHRHFHAFASGCEETNSGFSFYRMIGGMLECTFPPNYEVYLHDHPLIQALQSGLRPSAVRLSEMLPRSSWELTDHFNGMGRPLGLQDHLMVAAYSGNSFLLYSCYRDKVFRDEDTRLLGFVGRHAEATWKRVCAWEDAALPHLSLGLSASFRLQEAPTQVTPILRAYFSDWRDGRSLPANLERWVQSMSVRIRAELPHRPLEAYCAEGTRGKLYCRLILAAPGYRVTFTEVPALFDFSRLRRVGLTTRECEVLHWLSRGKRNREIGLILSVSPRTVDKHVEHLCTKFGVSGRSAVVSAARSAYTRFSV